MTVKKTILATGGAGAIGSRLVSHLCKHHRVLVLDDLSSGWFDNLRDLPVEFWRGSVTDEEILNEVFEHNPSVVFHLAANFANQNSVDYPQKDLMVNAMGTLKMLEFARKAKVSRFIYTSSSCVYGNSDKAIDESMVAEKIDTPYAISKLAGEQYIKFFHEFHNMPTVILRLFNSYGPGEYPGKYRNVIPNFVYLALKGQPLVVTGTGEETRDYTYIDDTISALLLAMSKPQAIGRVFNTGRGLEISTNELIRQIGLTLNKKIQVKYKPKRNWDSIMRRCANINEIKTRLGYCPQTSLSDGLKSTVEWFIEKDIKHSRMYN
jgi:UDP-glucose 4-epimerase